MNEPINPVVAPVVPTAQPAPAAPAPVATPAPVAPAQPAPQLPDNSRDRTRDQFDKLLDSNRRLNEANELLRRELQQRQELNNNFNGTQPKQTQTPQVPEQINPQEYVDIDPVTGERYINTERLNRRIADINQRASRAEQTVQQYIKTSEEREIDRQNKEAFTAYPELNPTNQNFDSVLNRQVRGLLYDSMLNADEYGGRPLTFKEAADFIRGQHAPVAAVQPVGQTAQAPTAQAPTEQQQLKEQASGQVPSQPANVPLQQDTEEMMRMRIDTRKGDTWTLARRLMQTEHAGTPSSQQ